VDVNRKTKVWIALAIILLIAVFTNPSEERHRNLVKREVFGDIYRCQYSELSTGFGLMVGSMMDDVINAMFTVDNYLVFSVLKVGQKPVGVGAFGNIYIFDRRWIAPSKC
jgi:hypothetical protein